MPWVNFIGWMFEDWMTDSLTGNFFSLLEHVWWKQTNLQNNTFSNIFNFRSMDISGLMLKCCSRKQCLFLWGVSSDISETFIWLYNYIVFFIVSRVHVSVQSSRQMWGRCFTHQWSLYWVVCLINGGTREMLTSWWQQMLEWELFDFGYKEEGTNQILTVNVFL